MNKKIKYITGTLLLITLLFVSCKNIFSLNNSVTKKSDDGKTYLCLKVTNSREAYRDLAPQDKQPFNIEAFTDFSLVGKFESEEGETLFEADTYDDIPQKIEIMSGQWVFYLNAKYNNIEFTAEQSKYINKGVQNTITFTLKPFEKVGGCDISFTLTDSQVSKVDVTLKRSSDGEMILDKTSLQIKDNNGVKTVSLKRSMSSEEERLSSGRYYLKFDFYTGEDDSKGYALLNEYESFLIITDAYTTSANINLDFNELYTISYHYEDDQHDLFELVDAADFAPGSNSFIPFYYSKGSEITLPKLKKSGKLFLGWKNYNGQNYDSDLIKEIGKDRTGNLFLTAEFLDTELYVSGTGDDSYDGLPNRPYKTIEKACEFIVEFGKPEAEWTIYIDGTVTGIATGTTGSALYAQSYIPDTVTTDNAKSILLKGKSALVNDLPVDSIDRGLNTETANRTSSNITGTALVINTSVPVTIENLKITKGNTDNSNYRYQGGGLRISSNSTVYLGDGVWFDNNVAYDGGAVYNAGTLYIYGTALIGTRGNKEIALGYEKYERSANFARYGGAIYNDGNLYIGYTKYVDENNITESDWEGEFNRNYAATGGAIYNGSTGNVKMRSGKIVYNASGSSGSGGGAIYNFGTFELTEDSLVDYNKSNSTSGGGVYNAGDSSATGIFIFSGGTISHNFTNGSGNGGGIFNKGILRIYGDAVIGDKNAKNAATGTGWKEAEATGSSVTYSKDECSNYASGYGGGICIESGEVYLGYGNKTWTGGIYYNYSKGSSNGGGGIAIRNTSAPVVMNSGTIACNATEGFGNAVYLSTGNGFTIGGNISIPAGLDNAQDIYYPYTTCCIKIAQNLNVGPGSIYLSPYPPFTDRSFYNTTSPVIQLTEDATGFTISDVKDKFVITPLNRTKDGFTTEWFIGDDGCLKQNAVTFEISASGTSFDDIISQINTPGVDYIIKVDGTVSGPVTLPATIQANSITIEGKNSSGATLKGSIDASSSSSGSALNIQTTKPVIINGMLIKGGKGTSIGSGSTARSAGGGIYMAEDASLTIDRYSKITENTSDEGAGIYVSGGAKLFMDTQSQVTYNTAITKGAGIYIATDGYIRIHQSSQCHVSYNKFVQGSAQVMGGGVYLEDKAVMEQYGGYIHDNEVNTNNAAGGLGSGVYVSSSGSGTDASSAFYKTLGYAQLSYEDANVPNDIYLTGSAKIEISNTMNAAHTPRIITLDSYEEDKELFTVATGVSSSITYMNFFEITPETPSDGSKRYWGIENYTGKLKQRANLKMTVTIPTEVQNDIQVAITQNGTAVENNTLLTGGTIVFTVTDSSNYDKLEWYLDGEYEYDETSYEFKSSEHSKGLYVIYLEAKDDSGYYYSYTAQVKVE